MKKNKIISSLLIASTFIGMLVATSSASADGKNATSTATAKFNFTLDGKHNTIDPSKDDGGVESDSKFQIDYVDPWDFDTTKIGGNGDLVINLASNQVENHKANSAGKENVNGTTRSLGLTDQRGFGADTKWKLSVAVANFNAGNNSGIKSSDGTSLNGAYFLLNMGVKNNHKRDKYPDANVANRISEDFNVDDGVSLLNNDQKVNDANVSISAANQLAADQFVKLGTDKEIVVGNGNNATLRHWFNFTPETVKMVVPVASAHAAVDGKINAETGIEFTAQLNWKLSNNISVEKLTELGKDENGDAVATHTH